MIKEEIIKKFNIPGKLVKVEQNSAGNIHKTYVATYEENGQTKRYLIQQFNNFVFKNPYETMSNIEEITNHIGKKLKQENDEFHKVLKVVKTVDNKNLLVIKNEDGIEEFYRGYDFIENTVSYDSSSDCNIVFNAGKAFGNFQKMLNGYPIDGLAETIKDFHNTKRRLENFENDIEKDISGRVEQVRNEIKFVLDRKNLCSLIVDKLEAKEIPLRVTHNDTKVNNVMLDKQTQDFVAVVDLDTVMPGSGLYDYADGIRSAASNSEEDEKDLNKVFIRKEFFEAYTDGYLSELAPYITKEELKLMANSILIITLELGMRFLNDYINGDVYFKCNYETHNLDRARNQFKLVQDLEEKMEYMSEYIKNSYEQFKN